MDFNSDYLVLKSNGAAIAFLPNRTRDLDVLHSGLQHTLSGWSVNGTQFM
jgi:hypothetical protein